MKRDIIGRGWAFPPGIDGQIRFLGGEEKIEQSILLILTTRPGERPLRPEFGCGVHDLVYQPNIDSFHAQVREMVLRALRRWEPRIDDVTVEVGRPRESREENRMDIHIHYRIRDTNAFYNLVYPLFVEEGAR